MHRLPLFLMASLAFAMPAAADPFAALPIGGQWRVVAIAGEAVPSGAEITLSRAAADSVGGKVICNTWSRPISASGEKLMLGGLTTTKMLCDFDFFKYEFAFNDLLGKVDSVREAAGGIELLANGAVVITAAR
ncbi:META domain-containing protein [Phaeovulum sp.]|uniref:META domain-containing protein n=1 Tax=Phaeovulum sp. TaxID=2934796 RepID=UPI003564C556